MVIETTSLTMPPITYVGYATAAGGIAKGEYDVSPATSYYDKAAEKIIVSSDALKAGTYAEVAFYASNPKVAGIMSAYDSTGFTCGTSFSWEFAIQAAISSEPTAGDLAIVDAISELYNTLASQPKSEVTVVTDNTLPVGATTEMTDLWFVDFNAMTADIDATAWMPTNLSRGAHVRLRKIDTSPYRITFTDLAANYRFVDQKSEFLTLLWSGADFQIV